MRTLVAVVFVICLLPAVVTADNHRSINLERIDFDQLHLIEIDDGYFGDVEMQPVIENIGLGKAPVNFYRLPKYAEPSEIILTTIVENNEVFYPLVVMLTEDYEISRVVDKPISIHRVNQYETSASIKVPIEPNNRYMLITTDPSLYGEKLHYKRLNTSMVRMYNGERYRYVPVTTGTREFNVIIGESGHIALSMPRSDY